MLAPGLHALSGHRPGAGVRVDIGPRCKANLAGAGRGQYQEFESKHRRAIRPRLPDLRQRGRHVAVGKRAMSLRLYGLVLAEHRLDGIGRIVGPKALRHRHRKNRSDALAHQLPRRRLRVPDGGKHAEHVIRRDVVNRSVTELRKDEPLQRRHPVTRVLRASPPALAVFRSRRGPTRQTSGIPRARRRSTFGLNPSRTMRRFSSATSRALARVTTGYGPSPNSCRRPFTVTRCFQIFAPPGVTSRNNPCPSNIRPGSVAAFTVRSVSAECSRRPPRFFTAVSIVRPSIRSSTQRCFPSVALRTTPLWPPSYTR